MRPARREEWRRTLARSGAVLGALAYLSWVPYTPLLLLAVLGVAGALGLLAAVFSGIALSLPRPPGATKTTAALGLAIGMTVVVLDFMGGHSARYIGLGSIDGPNVPEPVVLTVALVLPITLWIVVGLPYGPDKRQAAPSQVVQTITARRPPP